LQDERKTATVAGIAVAAWRDRLYPRTRRVIQAGSADTR